ncbi:MAG: hypothetical protein A3K19_26435 [Lentisphaerae bacterium RIFOXYB12_FULL_65_16]|nr:MAG: hypothetical protein A3K18_08605 [Lentisphaerae bacterium RIFOXYA12_64_32]OGV87812.1 MAG: hypothetical protein A3K19_26435 [Lentisphaerae bacterium RIFOXYB12_FULL_65_16]
MNVAEKVAAFRRNKRRFFAWHAGVLLTLCCLALLCLTGGADALMAFPAWARWLAFLALVVVGVGIVTRLWVLPCLRFDGRAAVREMEQGNPELGQMVRTSLQVGAAADFDRTGFSPALVQALHEQVGGRLAKVRPERLIPWRRVRRLGMACIPLVLAVLCAVILWADFRLAARRVLLPAAQLYFTCVTATSDVTQFERGDTVGVDATLTGRSVRKATLHLREQGSGTWETAEMTGSDATHFSGAITGRENSFEFFVTAGDGRSRIKTVRFVDPPVVRLVQARVNYPAYTGIAAQVTENRDVVAVEGSTVEFRFELNHALRRGRLRLGDDNIPVELSGAAALATWRVVSGDREFYLDGADADGLLLGKLAYTVRGLEDRVPRVEIIEPPEDVETTRNGVVLVRVRARDDFGLAQIGVVLRVDGTEFQLGDRRFDGELTFSAEQTVTLRLEGYPVSETTVNQVYAYARDRGPDTARRGVSEFRNIFIRSSKPPARSAPTGEVKVDEEMVRKQLENLRKLDEVIKEQRRAVSTAFRMQAEKARDPAATKAEAQREAELSKRVEDVREDLPELAAAEAKTALTRAAEQMQSASEDLQSQKVTPALKNEEAALASTLEAQRELQRQVNAAAQQQQQQEQQQSAQAEAKNAKSAARQEDLDALAKEAARLAQEEQQIGSEVAAASPQPPRRGQDAPAATPQAPPAAAPSLSQNLEDPEDPDSLAKTDKTSDSRLPEAAAERAAAQALTPRQEQAVSDAAELQKGVDAAAAATPLARSRMQDAAKAMQDAASDLAAQRMPEASGALDAAEQKLAQVAEHLRGLAESSPVAVLEQARAQAERAASELQPQGKGEEMASGSAPSPVPAGEPSGQKGSKPSPSGTPSEVRSPPSMERAAQGAETIADWLDRLQSRSDKGLEALQNHLAKARAETGLEQLPADVRSSQSLRGEGQTEQAVLAQKSAAERFERLATALDKAKQRLVQGQVERLAAAEAEARQLKQQLDSGQQQAAVKSPASKAAAAPASGQGAQKETTARLQDLAEELKDLNDAELAQLGNRLMEQVGPQNQRGKSAAGKVIPKEVSTKTLTPAVQRLQTMIDEIVQREMLLNRDERVPDKYTRLVDSYFKALSDDIRE